MLIPYLALLWLNHVLWRTILWWGIFAQHSEPLHRTFFPCRVPQLRMAHRFRKWCLISPYTRTHCRGLRLLFGKETHKTDHKNTINIIIPWRHRLACRSPTILEVIHPCVMCMGHVLCEDTSVCLYIYCTILGIGFCFELRYGHWTQKSMPLPVLVFLSETWQAKHRRWCKCVGFRPVMTGGVRGYERVYIDRNCFFVSICDRGSVWFERGRGERHRRRCIIGSALASDTCRSVLAGALVLSCVYNVWVQGWDYFSAIAQLWSVVIGAVLVCILYLYGLTVMPWAKRSNRSWLIVFVLTPFDFPFVFVLVLVLHFVDVRVITLQLLKYILHWRAYASHLFHFAQQSPILCLQTIGFVH